MVTKIINKLKENFKLYGTRKAINAFHDANIIRNEITSKILEFGADYIKTKEYRKLELMEDICMLKCEVYCSIFKIKL